MRVGIFSSHAYGLGGGFNTVWWFIYALRDMGHEVVYHPRGKMHPTILNNWFQGVPIQRYWGGCEAGYDFGINIDHFAHASPLAKRGNLSFIFFPQIDEVPPEGVQLLTVSNYTKEHVKFKWNRDAQTLYLPIKGIYKPLRKEKSILHVSRFTEPSEWADKAHRQMIQVFRMYSRELQGWELIFAGALDPDQEDYFNELTLRAKGLNCSFAMNPNDKEMASLYGRSAVYWHATGISMPSIPSAQEHLGLAPLEAQAAGCVPICFNSGGIPEVVLHGKTGILVDDPRQLGQMTVKLSNDWSAWSGMSQQAMRWSITWQDYEAFKSRLTYAMAGLDVPDLPDYGRRSPYVPSDVTAIIPTYKNADMLKQCLDSIVATAPDIKIIVVNNGGDIPYWDSYNRPDWKMIKCDTNLGFARANRLAEELVDTQLVLLINDDVVAISKGWVEFGLLEYTDDKVGIVGFKLIFPDGRLQHAGGDIDFRRDDIGYHLWYGELDAPWANQVEERTFVTGAAMLVKRELFHIDDYLLDGVNMEDVDICLNARKRGFKVVYQPAGCLIHHESGTKVRLPEIEESIRINKDKFRRKWANDSHSANAG